MCNNLFGRKEFFNGSKNIIAYSFVLKHDVESTFFSDNTGASSALYISYTRILKFSWLFAKKDIADLSNHDLKLRGIDRTLTII